MYIMSSKFLEKMSIFPNVLYKEYCMQCFCFAFCCSLFVVYDLFLNHPSTLIGFLMKSWIIEAQLSSIIHDEKYFHKYILSIIDLFIKLVPDRQKNISANSLSSAWMPPPTSTHCSYAIFLTARIEGNSYRQGNN